MINSKCAMMHALDAEACTVLSAHMHYMMIWLLKSASKPKQPVITVFSIKEVKSRVFSSISPLISCASFPSLFLTAPQTKHCGFLFSSSGHLSFFFPFTFFPLLPLICPLLSFSLPPSFPFFFPLSQPPLYLSLPPSLPSPCLSLSLPTCH